GATGSAGDPARPDAPPRRAHPRRELRDPADEPPRRGVPAGARGPRGEAPSPDSAAADGERGSPGRAARRDDDSRPGGPRQGSGRPQTPDPGAPQRRHATAPRAGRSARPDEL